MNLRLNLLNYLVCPLCKGKLELKIFNETDFEVTEGILTCINCGFSTAITDGIVNLLFNLDPHTLNEYNLHIDSKKSIFDAELANRSLEDLERDWAYLKNESSKDYGTEVKKIFYNSIKDVDIKKNTIILDLGAGTGWSTAYLAKMSDFCIAVDLCKPVKLELSKVFLQRDNVFFERIMANMMRLPFEDECFDLVTSVASLHHATNLIGAMREISRVLKVGGKLVLIGEPVVPLDFIGKDEGYIREKSKGFNEHQYSAKDWFKACEIAGLYAVDGKLSTDDLGIFYKIDKKNIQKPLPVFIKKESSFKGGMRIALLSQEFSENCNGGICKYTYDLCNGLAKSGHEVHIITKSESKYKFDNENIYVHIPKLESVKFLNLPNKMNISETNLAYSYSACLKLLELIEKFDIQIVEAPLWDAEGFVFSLIKTVPLVIRIETPLFKVADIQGWEITEDLKLANWMEGETARRADKVIAISENIATLIANHHGISRKDMELCPLGIALPEEGLLSQDNESRYFTILFVGRLEKRKGLDTLFRAMPSIIDAIPNSRFIIIGKDTHLAPDGGSYQRYLLENLNKKYHNHVEFLGYVDSSELNEYYRNCSVFVAPSLYESFGIIYLEAMAWGKPVVGCNVGGVPEIIQDGETGLIISPDDQNALSRAIIMLKDEKFRKMLGGNARNMVKSVFSMEKFIKSTISIYNKLL